MDRNENKERNSAESETRHFVRSHNKYAENAIFRKRDENTSILGERHTVILGITAGARKKRKPRMRWMGDIKSVTGHSVNDLNQLVKDRKKWKLLVNNLVKERKWTSI